MKKYIARKIYELLNAFSHFDRAIADNGIADRLSELEKQVGYNFSSYVLSDHHIKKAVATLKGLEFYEREADLSQIPLAERIKKIEEYLGIKFVEGTSRGYKPVKK